VYVDQPGTTDHYLKLEYAQEISVRSVATETDRRPGTSPLETVEVAFFNSHDVYVYPTWSAVGTAPDPGSFPTQHQVGTLAITEVFGGSTITVPVYGHEWSDTVGSLQDNPSPLVVTVLLDGNTPQIENWRSLARSLHRVELSLYAPGSTDVLALYSLRDAQVIGAEQSASGIAGEPGFNKLTFQYFELREIVGGISTCVSTDDRAC
jgi:hypothetical protein